MTRSAQTVAELVAALPELYQPIFGHPEFQGASRMTEDRVALIRQAAKALAERLGRPLRVLDLGCAQGYVSLSLATDGAKVTGIDSLPQNVAVARALAAENPGLAAAFEEGTIEDAIAALEPGAFDLVLGLSVFHHIAHQRGLEAAVGLIAKAAQTTEAGIYELALASEPVHWAVSLPEDHEAFLASYPFVHELARFPTHLSELDRPLCFASAKHWWFGGECRSFDRWTAKSHPLVGVNHAGTRRYFFGEGYLAKRFRLIGPLSEPNQTELQRESSVLAAHGQALTYPALIESGTSIDEAWLVRELTPGELLIDVIAEARDFDADRVIRDILQQLASLQELGLFHNDVTVWNVILTPDGNARLIDFGAISHSMLNCTWPEDLTHALVGFVHAVVTREPARVNPIRRPYISTASLPDQYRSAFDRVMAHTTKFTPVALLELLGPSNKESQEVHDAPDPMQRWTASAERHLNVLGDWIMHLAGKIDALAGETAAASSRLAGVEAELAARAAAFEALSGRLASQAYVVEVAAVEAKAQAADLTAIKAANRQLGDALAAQAERLVEQEASAEREAAARAAAFEALSGRLASQAYAVEVAAVEAKAQAADLTAIKTANRKLGDALAAQAERLAEQEATAEREASARGVSDRTIAGELTRLSRDAAAVSTQLAEIEQNRALEAVRWTRRVERRVLAASSRVTRIFRRPPPT